MISFVCCLGAQMHPSKSKRRPEHNMIFCFYFSTGRLLTLYHPRSYFFPFLSSPHIFSPSFSASSLTHPRDFVAIFRGSGRISGLFAGRVSGSRHQISRFFGYIKRADPFPAMQLHKRIQQERYYLGKDVS